MTIKIGLIGCGGIAEPHLNGYRKVEDARVTAVCDVVAENAKKRAEQAGGAQIFSDIPTLLAEGDIDAVDICLPHHLHKGAIVAAANAGKHILCEKPLCLTLEEAAAVKKAVSENGVTLMCAHNQLFMPPLKLARELIEKDTFGKVYEVRTTDSFYHNFNTSTMGWRAHREFIGGGELIDTGYHPSYMLLYLAGSRPVEVTAMLSQHRLSFMDGEDSAQVLVRFENGAVGNIVTGWAYEPADTTERFSAVAEKGYFSSDGHDLRYKVRGQDPVVINTVKLPSVHTFDAEIADFIACLQEGRRPVHNEDDGIHVLQVILGAYKSAEEKRTVALEEIEF
jgi:predicted dehydrogenase